VYITLKLCQISDDISSSIETCIADKSTWMNSNMLKLDKDQTDFIVFSSKELRMFALIYSMSVVAIGRILDNTLGMEKQVNSICKSLLLHWLPERFRSL